MNFGDLIRSIRRRKGWTGKEFIEKLQLGDKKVSPTYITKIELYEEIPSPEMICKMADILDYDCHKLFETAKQSKLTNFTKNLDKKYQRAVGLYSKIEVK